MKLLKQQLFLSVIDSVAMSFVCGLAGVAGVVKGDYLFGVFFLIGSFGHANNARVRFLLRSTVVEVPNESQDNK